MLPRLKYRNPALPITVDRKAAQSDPAVMTITFKGPAPSTRTPAETSPSSSSSPSDSANRVVTIQMKYKSDSEILQQLYEATGAKQIEPTEVEAEELRDLAEKKQRGREDSERMAEVNRQRRREAEMLAAARGQTGIDPTAV